MVMIINVTCTKCGKSQNMEIRNPQMTAFDKPNLKGKRKKCVWCEKSFKLL